MSLPHANKFCSSGRHRWFDAHEANRCCNGWRPVYVPAGYQRRLEEWLALSPQLQSSESCWTLILLPESATELYEALLLRCPPHYLSAADVNPCAH